MEAFEIMKLISGLALFGMGLFGLIAHLMDWEP